MNGAPSSVGTDKMVELLRMLGSFGLSGFTEKLDQSGVERAGDLDPLK